MVAPLIAAAIALGKQKLDDDNEQWKAMYNFNEQQRQVRYAQEAQIRAMRAARAGDSGYAQRAAGMILNSPHYEAPQSGMQEAGLKAGGALFAAQENAAKEAEANARWDAFKEALSRQSQPQPRAAAVPEAVGGGALSAYAGPDEDELATLSWG